jgi:histidine triad (HIT) family protein
MFPLHSAALGHTLVIPRRHISDLGALERDAAHSLTDAVLLLAGAIRRGLSPDGLNVIASVGAAATQTELHVHVHLVPRWKGDAFGDLWPRPSPSLSDEAVDEAAASIRAALD